MNYIILIIAGIVGIAIGRYLGKRRGIKKARRDENNQALLLCQLADSDGQVPKDGQAKEKEEKQKIN